MRSHICTITNTNTKIMQVAEVKLSYKRLAPHKGAPITSPKMSYEILRSDWDNIDYIESFKVMYLDHRNNVLAVHEISRGGTAGVLVDAKIVFQGALLIHASNIILAHNHPSGDTRPSQMDIGLTQKLAKAAKYLDLEVLDHIILTSEGFLSLADEGYLL